MESKHVSVSFRLSNIYLPFSIAPAPSPNFIILSSPRSLALFLSLSTYSVPLPSVKLLSLTSSTELSVTLSLSISPLPPFIPPLFCFSPWALLCLIYQETQTAVYSLQAAIRDIDHMGGIAIALSWSHIVPFFFIFSPFSTKALLVYAFTLVAFISLRSKSFRPSRAKPLGLWRRGEECGGDAGIFETKPWTQHIEASLGNIVTVLHLGCIHIFFFLFK